MRKAGDVVFTDVDSRTLEGIVEFSNRYVRTNIVCVFVYVCKYVHMNISKQIFLFLLYSFSSVFLLLFSSITPYPPLYSSLLLPLLLFYFFFVWCLMSAISEMTWRTRSVSLMTLKWRIHSSQLTYVWRVQKEAESE